MAKITLKGNPIHTNAYLPPIGSAAPAFSLTTSSLEDVTLQTYAGKKKILNIVPSLDTPVCATSTRKFNEEVSNYPNAVVLVISADLPFAQNRFCSTEGLKNVVALSTLRSTFARDYGVNIEEGALRGLCARAIVILNEEDTVVYSELVNEIAQEPNYAQALAAL